MWEHGLNNKINNNAKNDYVCCLKRVISLMKQDPSKLCHIGLRKKNSKHYKLNQTRLIGYDWMTCSTSNLFCLLHDSLSPFCFICNIYQKTRTRLVGAMPSHYQHNILWPVLCLKCQNSHKHGVWHRQKNICTRSPSSIHKCFDCINI